MKQLKYLLLAFSAVVLASCMGDGYAEPGLDTNPYGDNTITESNVLTVAQLKAKYSSYISGSSYTEVQEDLQVKGWVTGNDVGGNLYQQVALQDKTGSVIVAIAQGGLFGSLPVGQEVLINLKGLVVGAYGKQFEIGGIYTNTTEGSTSYGNLGVGAMSRALWESHYKLLGAPNAAMADSLKEDFDLSKISDASYMEANAGKLMTIHNVSFKDADGKAVYAPSDGSVKLTANCANRQLVDKSGDKAANISTSRMVVRTSSYADFANDVLRTDTVDITGIFTRYNNVWQILIRSLDDVTTATPADPFAGVDGTGEGTEASPFDVTRALSMINLGKYDSSTQYYITGIISSVSDVSTSYGNATYYISDDGSESNALCVFRGYYLNGDKFTDETKDALAAGKKVTIQGKLTLYNTTPEVNSGSKIISIQ